LDGINRPGHFLCTAAAINKRPLRTFYENEHWFGNFCKRSNITNRQSTRKFPSQHINGGLTKRPPNSLSGLHERMLRIPQETNESSGTLGSQATGRIGSLNEETVPPTTIGIYRTFPYVRLRLVSFSNANETGRYRRLPL